MPARTCRLLSPVLSRRIRIVLAPAHRTVADAGSLAGQLAKRGYPDDVADAVLDRLAAVGLINDADSRRAVGNPGVFARERPTACWPLS